MKNKQYQTVRLVTTFVLAFGFAQAFVLKNFFVALALLAVGSLFLLYMRRKVTDVLADERDYAVAGQAASLSIRVYGILAVSAMFFFYSLADENSQFYPIAMTLAFSTTSLMLLHALVFSYYQKYKLTDKKVLFTAFVLAFFVGMSILGLRIFSGEDSWVCTSGTWVAHGLPAAPQPTTPCN